MVKVAIMSACGGVHSTVAAVRTAMRQAGIPLHERKRLLLARRVAATKTSCSDVFHQAAQLVVDVAPHQQGDE
jgi:hypothetical protein